MATGMLIGGPADTSWREQALTRIAELEVLTEVMHRPGQTDALAERIREHLAAARDAAEGGQSGAGLSRLKRWMLGSSLERAASNIDAAETDLLRMAPDEYLEGMMPSMLAHVRGHLRPDDPRAIKMEELAQKPGPKLPIERENAIAAFRAAGSAGRREVVRLRSFRNVLYVATAILAVAALGLTLLGALRPGVVPLCFNPEGKIVCPTRAVAADGTQGAVPSAADEQAMRRAAEAWDVPLVQLLGLIAAGLAAATALRNIKGTSTPYALPLALALLKLPTGALTAVLGLLLMRANFVPGLSALDTSAQILAWAVVLGYAQQVFTGFVDRQANEVLSDVGARAEAETSPIRGVAPAPQTPATS